MILESLRCDSYMKLSMIKNLDDFFKVIDNCEGKVELVTNEGDRLNIKSQLSKYVSIAKIFSNGEFKKEIEIICYDPKDVQKLINYMYSK